MEKKSIKKDIEALLDMLPELTNEQQKEVEELRALLNKVSDEKEPRISEFYDDRL